MRLVANDQIQKLEEVATEFSKRLGEFGPVVIAGGAVRDSLVGRPPKDYDLFVLEQDEELDYVSERMQPYLTDLQPHDFMPGHQSEPFLIRSVWWEGVIVQILASPQPDLRCLVNTFDWNITLFGYEGGVFQNFGGVQPHVGAPLRLHKVTYPRSTLRRGFRYSERFQMVLEPETIDTLCRAVAAQADAPRCEDCNWKCVTNKYGDWVCQNPVCFLHQQ